MQTQLHQTPNSFKTEASIDFRLQAHNGKHFQLSELHRDSPVVLVFYPDNFTMVCTKQLCDYRDSVEKFTNLGVRLVGISKNDYLSHQDFVKEYNFPFMLLSDPANHTAMQYGCASKFMLGKPSRAIFIINKNGMVLYKYVEPTFLTYRKSDQILKILVDLKINGLL